MRSLKALLWGIGGAALGYYVGAVIACTWVFPTSNLCGIYGVFLTAPIGLVLGAVIGWRRSGPLRRP